MSITSKIQNLISVSNEVTGESDTTLTGAIRSLIDGYGAGGTKYVVLYDIKNATLSNDARSIREGNTYRTTVIPTEGYAVKTAYITMGGVEFANAYDEETKTITIANVSGDIAITVVCDIAPIDLLNVTWANHAITCGQDTNSYNAWSPHNLQYDSVNDCFVFLQCHCNKHLSGVYTNWTLSIINPYDSTDYTDITIPALSGLGMLFVENGVWTLMPRGKSFAYRSDDMGETWETLTADIPTYLFGVYKCGDTYFAGNDSNNDITYYKSSDLLTWTTETFDSTLGYSILCETTFCEFDGKYWAFNRTNDSELGHPVILQSTDQGTTWTLFSDQMLHGYRSTVSCYPFKNYIMVADIDRNGGYLYYTRFDGEEFVELNSWKMPHAGDDFHNVNIVSNYKDTVILEFMHAASGYEITSNGKVYTTARACDNVMIIGSTKELPSLGFSYLDTTDAMLTYLNSHCTTGLNSQRTYSWDYYSGVGIRCKFGESVTGFDDEIALPLNLIMVSNGGTRPEFTLKDGNHYAKAWSNSVTNPETDMGQAPRQGTIRQGFVTISNVRYAYGCVPDRYDAFPVLTRQNHVVAMSAPTVRTNENVVVGETWQEQLGFRRVFSINESKLSALASYASINTSVFQSTSEHKFALLSYTPVTTP